VASAEIEEEKREAASQKTENVYDMFRPLEGDCELKLLNFADPEGKIVFWHSSAHIMGEALENLYGAYLTHGPPLELGFFYDSYVGAKTINQDCFETIEKEANKIIKEKQKFERLVISKADALLLFQQNPFKTALIQSKVPENAKTTVYRCGNLVDLCTGPHVPNTDFIEAFKVTKNSGSYWLGKKECDSLQRVYGISYPSKKEMKDYCKMMDEAEKRDHRNLGKQQDLFFFNNISPGSCFYFPDGCYVYNKLVAFMREELRWRGYTEVLSPNIFNLKLWKTSGHYKNYKENMFILKVENQGFGMKPMNCPGHCMIYLEKLRSYKDFPLRYSEFGVLHRNEFSGALAGLFRVRRFVQDDAHIFVRPDQIEQEVMGCLDLADYIYRTTFKLDYELVFATRPEKFLGKVEIWDQAEASLKKVLDKLGLPWRLNPGDGAFYGPKIDILIKDALGRGHQIGTVQVDFQMPIRFNLQYRTDEVIKEGEKDAPEKERADRWREVYPPDEYDVDPFTWEERDLKPGFARPVMVHRAILGSIERFLGTLVENCMGKFPLWLSPRQVCVIPVSEKHIEFAEKVAQRMIKEGFSVMLERSNLTLKKKIRNMQLDNYNFAAVIGESDIAANMVDVRTRNNERLGKIKIDQFIQYLHYQNKPPVSNAQKKVLETMWLSEEERKAILGSQEPKFEFIKTKEPESKTEEAGGKEEEEEKEPKKQ
jgi:threonyl-tRNA synthetase